MQKFSELFEKIVNWLNKRQNAVLAVAIIFVALFWRLYKISSIPQAVIPQEDLVLKQIQNIINNNWTIAPSNLPQAAYYYLMSTFYALVKGNLLILRVFQAILGTFSIGIFYWFVKSWFNRQTALLASLFLSTNYFHLIISRSLEPKILILPVIIGFLYIVTTSLRTNKTYYFILAGLTAGLTFYIDSAFIFLPFIFLLALGYFYYKSPNALKNYRKNIFIASVSSIIILLPYMYYLPNFFHGLISPYFTPIGIFYLNLGSLLQTLFYHSQIRSIYGVGIEPVIDPFITISFISGLIYAIFYMRRRKFVILTSWFVLFVFLLSFRTTTNFLDIVYLLAPIYILASIVLDYVLTNWVRTFPFNKMARLLMTFAFSLFIFLSIFYNYEKYFRAWNYNLKENVKLEYQNK